MGGGSVGRWALLGLLGTGCAPGDQLIETIHFEGERDFAPGALTEFTAEAWIPPEILAFTEDSREDAEIEPSISFEIFETGSYTGDGSSVDTEANGVWSHVLSTRTLYDTPFQQNVSEADFMAGCPEWQEIGCTVFIEGWMDASQLDERITVEWSLHSFVQGYQKYPTGVEIAVSAPRFR